MIRNRTIFQMLGVLALNNWDSSYDFRASTSPISTKVYLIRHGQYKTGKLEKTRNEQEDFDLNDASRTLTDLGKTQAKATGQRLLAMLERDGYMKNLKSIEIVSSDSTRAKETAELIRSEISLDIKYTIDPLIREGPPIKPAGYDGPWKPKESDFWGEWPRIEAGFRKYFHRSDAEWDSSSENVAIPDGYISSGMGKGKGITNVKIMIGHGNVWRYSILRALQLEPSRWLNFSKANGSISELMIKSGWISMRSFGETGHFTPDMITFN
jgi:serine/threonine-protein phosphatase PGAM5